MKECSVLVHVPDVVHSVFDTFQLIFFMSFRSQHTRPAVAVHGDVHSGRCGEVGPEKAVVATRSCC